MGATTHIEWTDATWNPILGCSRVSEGCRNCYAETIAGRFGRGKQTVYSGLTQIVNGRAVWTGQIRGTRQLLQPLSWKKPKRVFVNSMSDLFHENVPDALLCSIFKVMCEAKRHTFQVLTKRPQRMLDFLSRWDSKTRDWGPLWPNTWPQRHIWLGVSVENQAAADERIPLLLKTPAAVRFLSCEPLLGPIDVAAMSRTPKAALDEITEEDDALGPPLGGVAGIDWVIAGGESGPGARPMHPDWPRSLRDQCVSAGVPFFFKQWGEWAPGENVERRHGRVTGATWGCGHWFFNDEDLANNEGHVDDEPDLYCVGKKAAGALLDGREWKQFPEVPR